MRATIAVLCLIAGLIAAPFAWRLQFDGADLLVILAAVGFVLSMRPWVSDDPIYGAIDQELDDEERRRGWDL